MFSDTCTLETEYVSICGFSKRCLTLKNMFNIKAICLILLCDISADKNVNCVQIILTSKAYNMIGHPVTRIYSTVGWCDAS